MNVEFKTMTLEREFLEVCITLIRNLMLGWLPIPIEMENNRLLFPFLLLEQREK
jgi:hypothetical protein